MGSSSSSTDPPARRARATARRRRSPPETATPSSPTGVSRPGGKGGHPRRSAGPPRGRRPTSCVAGVGPPQRHVGAHGSGEELGPLVDQGAGRPDLGLGQAGHGDLPRVSAPSSRGQNRRSALTRLDLPAPLDPVTATRAPGCHRQRDPVEGPGQVGRVAQRGVREGDLRGPRRGDGRRRRGIGHRDGHRLEGEQPRAPPH